MLRAFKKNSQYTEFVITPSGDRQVYTWSDNVKRVGRESSCSKP